MATPLKVDDFQPLPAIEERLANDCQPTLILVGSGGCGKTQYVKSLANENNWRLLIANHREGLKELTYEHDALFLDDLALQDINEFNLWSLLDSNDDRTLRILHTSVKRRDGLKQIFAFNPKVFRELEHIFERKEYSRRCIIVPIPSNSIINMNVVNNININIHNHIYNNPEAILANQQAIIDIESSKE